MRIFRFLALFGMVGTLVGCGGSATHTRGGWASGYTATTTSAPTQMQYGTYNDGYGNGTTNQMAVLLPLSGQNAASGHAIASAIEIAVLQHGPKSLNVSFHDTATNPTGAINDAIATNPAIIIGPMFANDARTLRELKTSSLPVLSFTSDAGAIGDGIMTMALMPTNSIEAIVKEIHSDAAHSVIIMAPDSQSGHIMAGAARSATNTYGINTVGIFYYTERDSESIKNASMAASMYNARTAANKRARAILSDVANDENLSPDEKSSISRQLAQLSKTETMGKLPYDAVLFLGTGDDSKTLASFLRYYGVGARDAAFYGTAMWDGADIASDFTMSGAKYAALPEINATFSDIYTNTTGTAPNRLATFGYDAAIMAMGMMYSSTTPAQYLLNPSGYVGIDGLVRLTPTGESERALRIMALDGSGTARVVKPAPTNFITPIYNIKQSYITPADAFGLQTNGINPMSYIKIPDRLRSKYKAKTYGANVTPQPSAQTASVIKISDNGDTITTPGFTSIAPEVIGRQYIDSIEIYED